MLVAPCVCGVGGGMTSNAWIQKILLSTVGGNLLGMHLEDVAAVAGIRMRISENKMHKVSQ